MPSLKLLTAFLLSCSVFLSYGQKNFDSTKVSGLVRLLAVRLGMDSLVAISIQDGKIENPEFYPLLKEFITRGKDYEFCELTNHPNPVVRCYAYEALDYTGSPKIIEVLRDHFLDTVKIRTRQGCLMGREKPIDIMVNFARGGRIIDRKIYPEKHTDPCGNDFIDKLTKLFEEYYNIKLK